MFTEIPKSSPIRRCVRRTENCPILETFLLFFTELRFGGVGAPEGRENVPDIQTKNFRKIKKVSASGGICCIHTKFLRKVPKLSAKILNKRNLTCDFLAEVEG